MSSRPSSAHEFSPVLRDSPLDSAVTPREFDRHHAGASGAAGTGAAASESISPPIEPAAHTHHNQSNLANSPAFKSVRVLPYIAPGNQQPPRGNGGSIDGVTSPSQTDRHILHSRSPPLHHAASRSRSPAAPTDLREIAIELEPRPVLLHGTLTTSGGGSRATSPTLEPTTLDEALKQLRILREEVAQLKSKRLRTHGHASYDYDDSGDRSSNASPFAPRGLDHSNEMSASDTRNHLERQYEIEHEMMAKFGDNQPRPATTLCCGCIQLTDARHRDHTDSRVSLDAYYSTSIFWLLAKRLPWLIALLIIQSFAASIMASYDTYLETHLVFTYFVPMVIGTIGNAGNQCSVMVTRACALGMGDRDVWRVVQKETPVAFLTAILLGAIAFVRVIIEYPSQLASAGAIALTLGVSIVIAIALGIACSYGLEKIRHCDPADGAAPLLMTISDLIGIGILCGIAVQMVH